MTTPEQAQPVHPMVEDIVRQVQSNGADKPPRIPEGIFHSLEKSLRQQTKDMDLFVQLVVLSVRLEDAGLVSASEQLMALAMVGLDAAKRDAVIATMGDRKASAAPKNKSGEALENSVRAAKPTGIGLRKKN